MTELQLSGQDLCIYLLDIDGTVMPSSEIDNQCFWQAIDDVLGGVPETLDLHGFTEVTDSGILAEWIAREGHDTPGEGVSRRIRDRFLQLTRRAAGQFPQLFQPSPGLVPWIRAALASGRVGIGFATGGWRHTAQFKLATAGLDGFSLPLASSDDAIARCDIMQLAFDRTQNRFPSSGQQGRKMRICYIGDSHWDLEASRTLGWEFIGIADGKQAEMLGAAGAKTILRDFTPLWKAMS